MTQVPYASQASSLSPTLLSSQKVPSVSFLLARIADLEKQLAEKEKLLETMGVELAQARREKEDFQWMKRLEVVSTKRCSTPQKKILEALRDLQNAAPHTAQRDFQVHITALAQTTGMCKRTIETHLAEMEQKEFIHRRYEGNGQTGYAHRDALFIRVDDRILHNPSNIHKMVPVDKPENRGGYRGRDELICSNCGSPHVRGHRHESGLCDDCGKSMDVWQEFPESPEPVETAPIVVAAEPVAPPVEDKSDNLSHLPVYAPRCKCRQVKVLNDLGNYVCPKCDLIWGRV